MLGVQHQGSVLGPVLCNVYINDFHDPLKDTARFVLYADDTTILVTSKDLTSLNNKLNRVVTKVTNWFRNNNLVANMSKTNLINL
jgi:hypothetical protein